MRFWLYHSFITILLRLNILDYKKNHQMISVFLTNEENLSHFLENNWFFLVIYKYTSAIISWEMEIFVAHKIL